MTPETIYYDWVPFFRAIGQKIYDVSQDQASREQKLQMLAHGTFAAGHTIFNQQTIDPFSYIYALAQRNTVNQRAAIFSNAKQAFGIAENIPTDYNFPTPTPNTPTLFHVNGVYESKVGMEVGNECIWNLFVQAYQGDPISDNDFRNVLSLKTVGFTKISQILFLINPDKYIPFDTQMNSLPGAELENLSQVVARVETEGFGFYLDAIKRLQKRFPGCKPYEINLLNVLINFVDLLELKISDRYCQISSWADGKDQVDYFDDFVLQNAVWTGGPGGMTGAQTYPLQEIRRGDVMLVRRGTKHLGGIGVVLENQYFQGGYAENAKIKIVWIAKQPRTIEGKALGQWIGFDWASDNTYEKFRNVYPESFSILNEIGSKQRKMVNHEKQQYKNLILQGPPGTGKTRLAKQIALWLTDDAEKSLSLIEAIDQKVFRGDPDIKGKSQIKLIQFHPSYTYEDFVRGIKADIVNGQPKYEVENRILAAYAEEASKPENKHKAFVLIIDEINRANLTAVLGELIYALEYRGKSVTSMYAYHDSNEISLPHNLYIIGTMNTADRSVSHVDYAIRRRFTFVQVPPDRAAITYSLAAKLYDQVAKIFDEHTSPEFRQEDIQIGHSYFLHDDAAIGMRLKYEIKPLLIEYVNDGILLEVARDVVKNLHVERYSPYP